MVDIYCGRNMCDVDSVDDGELPGYQGGKVKPGEKFENRVNRGEH